CALQGASADVRLKGIGAYCTSQRIIGGCVVSRCRGSPHPSHPVRNRLSRPLPTPLAARCPGCLTPPPRFPFPRKGPPVHRRGGAGIFPIVLGGVADLMTKLWNKFVVRLGAQREPPAANIRVGVKAPREKPVGRELSDEAGHHRFGLRRLILDQLDYGFAGAL